MEKRNRKAGHSYSLRDRILAQIMVIIVTLTMIPFDSLVVQAASTTTVKSVGSIRTEYEVDYGTSKDDIGLPSELSVILETAISSAGATNGGTEYSEDAVDESVSWEGYYDGDTPGTYALTAEFDDGSLYYDDMPTVHVTVREPETAPGSNAGDEGDDDEDPDQPVVTGETEGQSTENSANRDGQMEPGDQADYNFGDDPHVTTMSLSVSDTSNSPCYAGDTFNYILEGYLFAPATYRYDISDEALRMYDEWKDLHYTIKLPQGVSPVEGSHSDNVAEVNLIDAAQNLYEVILDPANITITPQGGIYVNAEIGVMVDDNGVVPAGTVLPAADVEFFMSFDCYIDRNRTQTRRYDHSVGASTEEITLGTPDEWKLTKHPYNGTHDVAYSIEGDEVTVHYIVRYGLLVGTAPSNDPEVYKRNGRVPFDPTTPAGETATGAPRFKDNPTLTLSNGTQIDPLRMTITPREAGYVYLDGTSADNSAGEPIAISVTAGAADGVEIPYATVPDDDETQMRVDKDAPAYSEYYVDVVYDYDEFQIWYYDNPANRTATSHNTAHIDYRLAGLENDDTEGEAETTIPAYIPPAQITIKKYLVNYDGIQEGLYNANRFRVSGPATYKITKEDGSAATIYYIDGDGNYQSIGTNVVTIDPSGAAYDTSHTNSKTGAFTFYLDAGQNYVIEEIGKPTNTDINQGDTIQKTVENAPQNTNTDVEFRNKEILGKIEINKVDDSPNEENVDGAVFGLFYDEACTQPVKDENGDDYEVETVSGKATFERLIPDTYYVKELSCPEGYTIIATQQITEADVTAGVTKTVKVVNHVNSATIKLIKEYSTVTAPGTWIQVNRNNFNDFSKAFVLEQSLDDGNTWSTFKNNISLGENGTTTVPVPEVVVVEGVEVLAQYRFVETIPDGYYAVDGTTDQAISDVLTPGITGNPRQVTMRNKQGGKIILTKYRIGLYTDSGVYADPSTLGNAEFDLYYVEEGSTAAQFVAHGKTANSGTNKGKVTFEGLLATSANNKLRTYYVVETNCAEKDTWQTTDNIMVNGVSTPAVKVGTFTGSDVLTRDVYNLTSAVSFWFVKKDSLTDEQLAGCTIHIKDTFGDERDVTTSANAPKISYARVGGVITFTETQVPAGYYLDPTAKTIDTTGWKVKREDNGTVKVVDANGNEVTQAQRTITFTDAPYPKVTLQKKRVTEQDSSVENGEVYDNAIFKFYTYSEEDGYVPYTFNGSEVSVRSDGQTSVTVDPGEYWLHEENCGTDVINPDVKPDLYAGMGEYSDDDEMFFFGPYTVNLPTTSDNITQMIPSSDDYIINISNKANLTVNKKYFDVNKVAYTDPLKNNGFSMQLYRLDKNGNEVKVGKPVATGNKPSYGDVVNGQAVFENLPVYDSDGNKIQYFVREVVPDNATYDPLQRDDISNPPIAGETAVCTLTSGDTSKPSDATNAGEIWNIKKPTAQVTKKYKDMRENDLIGTTYNLQEAVIALYAKKADGTYEFYGTMKTSAQGQATFVEIPYEPLGYVGIEVSIPDKPECEYMVPVDLDDEERDVKLLSDDYATPPETLTESEIAAYNYKELTYNESLKMYTATLWNQIPWTQIHITKYWKNANNTDDTAYVPLDGTDFTLYKQVLPEDTPVDAALTFDASDPSVTVVGTYTSGSWLVNGQEQTGELQTDVLDNADNIVYWVVETRPTPGYRPAEFPHGSGEEDSIILFHREGTSYTNNSVSIYDPHKPCTRDQILEDNKVNYDKVHNWTGGETPGEGYINIAYIKFSKWGETNGNNYELLPNATFELWAVKDMGEGESPERVKLLDTITTGDENLVIEGDTTGHGVSVAIDAWDLYDELSKKYSADELSSIMWFEVHEDGHLPNIPDSEPYTTDGTESHRRSGTFYLNATLKEVGGPALYTLDTHYHNLLITFPTGDFELGNDKYFVTDIDAEGVLLCNDNGAGTEETAKYNDYQHVAIVDPLAKNHPVTFRHFGYDPAVVGKEMSHKDLLDALGTNGENFLDKEVTFRLERYDELNSTATDEIWNDWFFKPGAGQQQGTASEAQRFSCSGDGYTFPDGLIDGDYRVIMETPAEGYENFYTEATPFYFTVRASSGVQVFTTFSPEKPDLTINKISVGGVPVTGKTTFKLDTIPAWANVYPKTADAENGNPAVFEDLGADRVFYIEETASPAGYTNRYFKELFKETYKDKGDLVNLVEKNTGYAVSYATTTADNEEGQYVPSKSSERKLVEETVIVDKDYLTDFTLTVKNAKLVNLEISKVNAQDLEEYLGGAVFSLYFKPFENFEEHYTVPTYTDGDSSWKMIGNNYTTAEEDDPATEVVEETGKVLVQNLEPGVYHVKEVTAPGGFDLNTEGKTIVITGGMNIPDLDPASEDYDLYTGEGGKAEVTVANMPKTGLKVQKVVEFGDYPETDYSFSFVLKDAQGTSIAGDPAIATKDQKANFKELTQGDVYYLMEVAQAGYKIKEVKVNGETVSPESSGDFKNHYKITMPEDGTGVEVVVTNIRMEAQVDIFKYDGDTGEGLTGAEFEVRTVEDDPDSVVEGVTITGDPNIDGKYTIVIPMDNTKQTYYIRETKAPTSDYYVINPEECTITVEDLEPGQQRHYHFDGIEAQDNEYVLPNYVGARISVAKYGGLQDQEGTATLEGAELQIYYRNPEDPESVWNPWNDPKETDANGAAEFLVLEGFEYAIAETNVVAGYIGLNNVIDKDGNSVPTDTADGRTIFIIGSDFENDNVTPYEYTAYNIPYLSLVVNKVDALEPSTVTDPNATFVVCEVPSTTSATLTREECLALVQQAQAQGSGYRFISDHTTNSTYSNDKFLIPGKKYLAVELTAMDTGSTQGDYSIILDDSRVVSYEVFEVPLTGYKRTQPYEVTFKNVQGDASVTIDKTVNKTTVPSLVTEDANLVYTLTPGTVDNVANEYALDSYIITDTGLKVTNPESGATLAAEWYTITKITVGSATMDTSIVGTDVTKDYPIKAIVTLYDFNGDECGQTEVNVSNNTPEVNVAEVATGYVKSFTIEYIAKSDNDAENFNLITGYALGQHFQAEPTLVDATVFMQEKVGDESITEIKKFQNDVDIEIKYTPSKSNGEKDEQVTKTDHSLAITETDSVPAPRIAFTKHIVDEENHEEQIGKKYNIGDKITYTLKVENVSPEPAVLTNPVVVDLLPKGVIVDIDTDYMTFTAPSGITQEAGSPSTGYAGESQYVLIEFNGELAKDEAIEIKLEAEITSATALYGTTFTNYAFTTSTEVGVATEDNMAGAVIQDPTGAWASPLEDIADALGVDPARAGALKEALDEYGDHGFLGGSWYNTWEKTDGQIAVKAQRGPNDSAWKTEDVARLENDENVEAKRTMKYQLTVLNPTTDKRTNLAVMDVMPTLGDWRLSGDTRKSEWSIYFKGPDVDSVMVNGEANTDYTIYYFTGDATQFDGLTAYTDILAAAKSNSLDSSWTTAYPGDNKVTAFILVFDYDPNEETATTTADTVVLEPTGTIQIEYTATTPFREADDLNPIVFTNAVNDFNYGYKTFPATSTANHAYGNSVLDSNTVEVTITPPEVMVGGDVWIDADDNGEQDDSDAQNQSWYLRYDIVQELANQLGAEDKITLNTSNRRSQAITETSDDNNYLVTGSDAANYGISHFEFHHLIAAKLKEGRDNYTNWVMEDLVGANPYTHNIDIIYDGNTFYKTINVVNQGNELTHGRGSYSPEPDEIPDIQKKDDNFINVTRGSAYKSEWFFLHQTSNVFDMTKDIGFNVPRTLKLQKKDKNGNGVNGAKFDVWGPFEVQEDGPFEDPAERVFDDDHYVGEYVSETVEGVDGMVVIEGLKFFKEYVIVEKEAPEGYSINGATAEGPVEEIDISSEELYDDDYAAWLYTVPDTSKRPNDEGDIIDTVTVTDPDLIKIRPVKIWNDNDDPYGVRPASIFVQLYTVETNDQSEEVLTVAKDNSGEDVSAIELKSDNNYGANEPYTYWENLPKYNSDSEEIVYTIKEYVAYTNEQTNTPLAGYTASEPELVEDVITITNTPPYTQLTVNKEWEGDTGADVGNIGNYIKSVTFKVQRKVKGTQRDPEDFIVNGSPLTCVVERGDGDQYNTYTFSNLPAKSASGDEYEYSAKEVSMIVVDSNGNESAGDLSAYTFTHTASGTTVTYTNTLKKGKLQFFKDWDDEDDQDGVRPDSVTLSVTADATDYFDGYNATVTLNEDNEWGHDSDNPVELEVPVKDAKGNTITYTIVETPVPAGYTVKYVVNGGAEADSASATVVENEVTTVKAINKHEPNVIKVIATKDWNDDDDLYGERPKGEDASITFTLYADNEPALDQDGNDISVQTIRPDENGDWPNAEWDNLPEKKDGEFIVYTVEETEITGYTTEYDPEDQVIVFENNVGTITVINTPIPTSLHIKKTWANEIDDEDVNQASLIKSVTFTIQKSVKDADSWSNVTKNNVDYTITLERVSGATFTEDDVTGLPKYNSEGQELEYRAVETSMLVEDLEGNEHNVDINGDIIGAYNMVVNPTESNITEITNSFIKGWLKVKKIWVDNNDRDGIRPQSLTITITEDSDFIDYTGTIVLNDDNNWGADLDAIELPVKNLDGSDITYTITEEAVTGYTPEYEITVDGVKVSEGEAVTGTTTLTEDETTEDTYTNTHEPETTSKTVTKFWDDEEDLYGNRPETITFALYRTYDGLETPELVTVDDDGVALENPKTVSKNDQGLWTYTWTNLPVYLEGQAGTAITYSVAETEINGIPVADFYGYTVTADGDTIINTPVTTGLDIYKYWDANELSCIADTVTEVKFKVQKSINGTDFDDVEYTVDGTTKVLETTIVKSNGTWGSAEVNGLPAYDPDNNPYTYRAKEIAIKVNGEWVDAGDDTVGGYNISQEDTPGANTPAPATARDLSEITNTPIRGQLGVKKVWEDQDNAYNTRPRNITVTLEAEANGVAITGLPTSTVLNATNGWEDTTTWGSVPVKDAAGNNIEYTFTEPTTGSYKAYVTVTSEEEGNTGTTPISEGSLTEITFTNKLITTSFNVEKKFPDETNEQLAYFVNQFKSQIKSIKVRLQRQEGEKWIDVLNNNAVVEVDLNEQNGWKYTWENLPKNYADGTLIQYRAIEVSYTTENDTHEVTYTDAAHKESGTVAAFNYTSTTVAAVGDDIATTTINNSIKVGRLVAFKIWDDDNDRDDLRPEDITFHLFCNGEQLPADVYDRVLKAITDEAGVAHDDQTTVPMEDENNFVEWTILPVYDVDGINYKYSYSEKLGSGSAANPPQYSIIKSIMNIFLADNEDADAVDPTEDTGDGTTEGGAAGGEGSGNAQTGYAVEIEDSTGDYTATVDVELPTIIIELSDVITKVTNTHEPLVTEMSVKKEWEGNFIYGDHPKEVIVYLRAKYEDNDGNIIDELAQPEHKDHKFVNPVTLNEENNWEYTWTDLPVNKTGYVGHEITYYVVEEPVPNGFELDPDKQEMIREVLEHIGSVDVFTSKFTVVNTMLTTSLEVNKEWIDEEPAIAEKIKSVSFKVQRSIDDGTTWMDLVITDPEDEGQEAGQVVILTIDKEETTAYIDNLPTHSAEGDAYLYRAVEIGYTLKDGTFVKVKYDENTETSGTVGAYNYTSETINPGEGTDPTEPTEPELPQRGEAGDGTEGPGETPETTDGYVTNVTNKTIRGAIKVTKTWKNDSDNNRPKSLKIQLTTFAGKNKITLKGIKYSTELTSANNWTDTTTWEKVPVLDEYGNKIIYMLEEPEVNRYSASYQIVYNNKELESGSSRAFSTDVYENGVIEGRLINRYNPPANKTGDDAPLAAAGGALAVGLAGLAAVLARKKRRV